MTEKLRNFAMARNTQALAIIFVVIFAVYAVPSIIHRSQNPILQRSGLARGIESGYVNGQSTIDPNDGFTSQALGHAAAESWLKGDIPYWNHNEGVGMPLAAGMQSAAFFPLTLILHFYNGAIYFHFLLQLLAGFTAYLFFKKLKIRFSLAVLGGLLFALNGAFAWLTNAAFNPIAFLPMLLLGFEYAVSCAQAKKRGGWILIALALSLSLYSGFPETAFISAIFAYGWAAVRLLQIEKEHCKSYIYKILLGSIIGLLLTAPILVAFLGYLPHTITGGHESGGYANFGLPLKTLPALFMPYIYGPIFGSVASGKPSDLFIFWSNVGGYLTVPLLLTALMGWCAKRPRALKLYLFIFSVVIILKNYGFKPVVFLINLIPGMNQVAFYRYSVPALSMAVILLALFGADAFIKSTISRKKSITLVAAVSGFVLVLAFYSRSLLHQLIVFPSHRLWALFSVMWALSIVVIAGLTFCKSCWKLVGVIALLSIDSLTMFMVPYLSLPKIPSIDMQPVSHLQQNLGTSRFYTLHPIAPNYGSYFNIASININDLPLPENWANYIPKKLDDNAIPLVFTGYSRVDANGPTALDEFARNKKAYENIAVKYLVVDKGQVSEQFKKEQGLELANASSGIEVYKLPNAKGYYETESSCSLTDQTRDTVTANCKTSTTLVRRELIMPGWSVKVNATQQNIKTKDEIFQSVVVPAGKSIVTFTYTPPLIGIGYTAFGVALVVILLELATRIPVIRQSRFVAYFLRTVRLK
jgi:hypothetical protein